VKRPKDLEADYSCGWVYDVPETRFRVSARTWAELYPAVVQHYSVNSLDIPHDLQALILDQIAGKLPADLVTGD